MASEQRGRSCRWPAASDAPDVTGMEQAETAA